MGDLDVKAGGASTSSPPPELQSAQGLSSASANEDVKSVEVECFENQRHYVFIQWWAVQELLLVVVNVVGGSGGFMPWQVVRVVAN